jgi:hypothetical protein
MPSIMRFDQWQNTLGQNYGTVLQVVTAVKTDTWSANSATPLDITGLSAVITPRFSTSRILLTAHVNASTTTTTTFGLRFTRNGSAVGIADAAGNRQRLTARGSNANVAWMDNVSMTFLDSPATTSPTTYVVQAMPHNVGWTVFVNRSAQDSDDTTGDNSRTISTLTLMEIAQ